MSDFGYDLDLYSDLTDLICNCKGCMHHDKSNPCLAYEEDLMILEWCYECCMKYPVIDWEEEDTFTGIEEFPKPCTRCLQGNETFIRFRAYVCTKCYYALGCHLME